MSNWKIGGFRGLSTVVMLGAVVLSACTTEPELPDEPWLKLAYLSDADVFGTPGNIFSAYMNLGLASEDLVIEAGRSICPEELPCAVWFYSDPSAAPVSFDEDQTKREKQATAEATIALFRYSPKSLSDVHVAWACPHQPEPKRASMKWAGKRE